MILFDSKKYEDIFLVTQDSAMPVSSCHVCYIGIIDRYNLVKRDNDKKTTFC